MKKKKKNKIRTRGQFKISNNCQKYLTVDKSFLQFVKKSDHPLDFDFVRRTCICEEL